LWDYFGWKLNPFRARKTRDTVSHTPVVSYRQQAHGKNSHIAWLGHSTILLSLQGKTILVDPILSSPRLFHGNRLGRLPVTADKLSVDMLLATHAHRDHLDRKTVKDLKGDSMKAFVPLKVGALLRKWRPGIEIQEAGWYQSFQVESGIHITLLPAYHWSRRSLFDTNAMLWGSYVVEYQDTTLFFAGDTGYADHFQEIGALFDEIDYAILPIGSYEPGHIQKNSHMTPEQALQAFDDLGAKTMIPIHYGTYDLSDEPVAEPLARLQREISKTGVPAESVRILDIGEIHYLNP